MSQHDVAARELARGSARRWAGRDATVAATLVATVVGLVLVVAPPTPLRAQDEDEWVGQRVVQKSRNFVLRIDDEPLEGSGKAIVFYRVERTEGPSLWLKAEGQRLSGW